MYAIRHPRRFDDCIKIHWTVYTACIYSKSEAIRDRSKEPEVPPFIKHIYKKMHSNSFKEKFCHLDNINTYSQYKEKISP